MMGRQQRTAAVFIVALLSLCIGSAVWAAPNYLIGVGKADITGPAADVEMMGYASPTQIVGGIHTRLFARAYIVADPDKSRQRFVFVNLDACMASQAVTLGVLAELKNLYGDTYTSSNLAISGIHTHSGPAGYLQYVLYTIPSLGFVPQSFDALVDGIVEAVKAAHESVQPGSLAVASGELVDANINRSPSAYLANPAEERARYKHDTDKTLTLLKVMGEDGRGIGSISWYAVHCTSINNTNTLISGDNKGVASQLLEKWAAGGPEGVSPGFVAAFGQSNVGDTSPNINGTFCFDTDTPCDGPHSLCNGRNVGCIGRGPAWPENFRSNEIIAGRQAGKARELWADNSSALPLSGPVDFRHAYVNMRDLEVRASNVTRAGKTCPAAMGFSFAAGTTDGPGAFDFKQGDTNGTAFWRAVRNFIRKPSEEQEACQAPKPVLLDTGNIHIPYDWQPSVVEVQILRAGQLLILCVPGEFTTMAGRRLREAVHSRVSPAWGDDVTVVIAGLTNTYSSYITTFEEYQVQRYEGASTLYGPHTLDAYIQEFLRLADAMVAGEPVEEGSPPPNLIDRQWSFLTPVVLDTAPPGMSFGDVMRDVQPFAYMPGHRVEVAFVSACPRNNLRTGGTFLTVERKADNGTWEVVHTDNDISTKFYWRRPFEFSPESTATITWDVPEDALPGIYRIRYFGDYKRLGGSTAPFSGMSGEFKVGDRTQVGNSDAPGGALPRKALLVEA